MPALMLCQPRESLRLGKKKEQFLSLLSTKHNIEKSDIKRWGIEFEFYKDTTTGVVNIAFRGSKGFKDYMVDGLIAANISFGQADVAQKMGLAAKEIFGTKLTFCGHSKGGYEAQFGEFVIRCWSLAIKKSRRTWILFFNDGGRSGI